MSVSDNLYSQLLHIPESELDSKEKECYLWIWIYLLGRESAETLEADLKAIQQLSAQEQFAPQIVLELAWKAEAIEILLDKA